MYLKKCTNHSKHNLPRFDENFANLCTAKLKSTLVDNKLSNTSSIVNVELPVQLINLLTTGG